MIPCPACTALAPKSCWRHIAAASPPDPAENVPKTPQPPTPISVALPHRAHIKGRIDPGITSYSYLTVWPQSQYVTLTFPGGQFAWTHDCILTCVTNLATSKQHPMHCPVGGPHQIILGPTPNSFVQLGAFFSSVRLDFQLTPSPALRMLSFVAELT